MAITICQDAVSGVTKVVILKKEQYDRLTKKQVPLVEFIAKSPLAGLKINFKRDKSPTRDID